VGSTDDFKGVYGGNNPGKQTKKHLETACFAHANILMPSNLFFVRYIRCGKNAGDGIFSIPCRECCGFPVQAFMDSVKDSEIMKNIVPGGGLDFI